MSFIKKIEKDYNEDLISLKELEEMRNKYSNLKNSDKLILDQQSVNKDFNSLTDDLLVEDSLKSSIPKKDSLDGSHSTSSVGMFINNFSSNGRIRRLEFGLSILIYYGVTYLIGYTLGYMGVTDGATYGLGILYISIIPMLIWFIMQGAKRSHDMGNSGWYQLIPFYILWMLFAEGENKENKYGFNPKG